MNVGALQKYDDILEGYSGRLTSDERRFIRDATPLKAAAKVRCHIAMDTGRDIPQKQDVQYLRRSDAIKTTLLLFNDKLLVCQPKGKKLSFKKDVPLYNLVVIDTELHHPGTRRRVWKLLRLQSTTRLFCSSLPKRSRRRGYSTGTHPTRNARGFAFCVSTQGKPSSYTQRMRPQPISMSLVPTLALVMATYAVRVQLLVLRD